MTEAGYNPKAIIELMQILGSARSGGQPPEFLAPILALTTGFNVYSL